MDGTRDRSSGIPRLSRLPVPRHDAAKSMSSAAAAAFDRTKGSGIDSGRSELNVPKLRPALSRERLGPGVVPSNVGVGSARTLQDQSRRVSSQPVTQSHARAATSNVRPAGETSVSMTYQPLPALAPTDSGFTLPSRSVSTSDVDSSGTADNISIYETPTARKFRPRPSLTERTMETLARVPSSPAVKGRSSTFFEHSRPRSRADGGASQPASQHSFPVPSGLAGNSGTPRKLSGPAIFKTPNTKPRQNQAALASATNTNVQKKFDAGRRVSPDKDWPGKSASQRNLKPAVTTPPTIATPARELGKSARPSVHRGPIVDEQRRPAQLAGPGINPGSIGGLETAAASLTSRKSSAALREQIAKAKAAKSAATLKAKSYEDSTNGSFNPVTSRGVADTSLDNQDPFNLCNAMQPFDEVLRQRITSARTTGRLNIAALGLKSMPLEVTRMYDVNVVAEYDGNWAESVDLTRLVAADNEIEGIDDDIFPDNMRGAITDVNAEEEEKCSVFGALETIDLHGNLLTNVPKGFRSLVYLTSLNLSSNKLENECLEVVSQISSLRELKLSKNRLSGPLSLSILRLSKLEVLDLHGNGIAAIPDSWDSMPQLRILNLNENQLEALPFDSVSRLPLTELSVRKNRLSGALIKTPVESLSYLQSLDASANQLTHLVPAGSNVDFPVAHFVSLSGNRFQCLPDMSTWTSLLTLLVDDNHLPSIPDSLTSLQKLRHADFSGNDIRVLPPEIARMQGLFTLRLTGNPMRDRKLVSASTDELKKILAARLEPPPPYQESSHQNIDVCPVAGRKEISTKSGHVPASTFFEVLSEETQSDAEDDFTTPPTSAPATPSRTRSETVVKDIWFVKQGGLLDLTNCGLSSLCPEKCYSVASQHQVRQMQLHHNPMASIPSALNAFGSTLTSLSLANMQLSGDAYLTERVELPALRDLSLTSNRITSVEPLTSFLYSPELEKLDVSLNRLSCLLPDVRQKFPRISVLIAASNQITDLDPECIRGIKTVDVSRNEIVHLNARLGLLGGVGGLQRLEVGGNRFKVPRWSILEQGTEATLRWLRGRLPADEMTAWKDVNDGADDR